MTAGSSANAVSVLLGNGASPGEGNLLADPGAEGPGAAGSLSGSPAFAGWTRTGGLPTFVRYGSPGFPSFVDAGRVGGGTNLFSGGPDASASAEQTVDVADRASSIDAGLARAALSGLIGGHRAEDDAAVVSATFIGAGGQALGSPLTIGLAGAAARHNQTILLRRTAAAAIPTGTRGIRVAMLMTRAPGAHFPGFLDDLSLRVSLDAPAPAAAGRRPAARVGARAPVSADGVATVTLSCPAASATACRGILTLDVAAPASGAAAAQEIGRIARGGRRISLGKRAYSLSAGRVKPVATRLTRAGRALIATHPRLRARAVTTAVQPDGTRTVRTSRITLIAKG